MKTLLEAGASVQGFFERQSWRFCFIGGIANFRWGTPRLTNDLDLTLLTGFGRETPFVEALLAAFTSRVPDPIEFAATNRVVLLRTPDGVPIDVALGAMPFEERAIHRSSNAELAGGVFLRTCSAEDLMVHKVFAARPQDWVDVEGIIVKQSGRLGWQQIWSELHELVPLKGEPGLFDEFRRVIARAQRVTGPFEFES